MRLRHAHEEMCFAAYDWAVGAGSQKGPMTETRAWLLVTLPHATYVVAALCVVFPFDLRRTFLMSTPLLAILAIIYGVWFDDFIKKKAVSWDAEFSGNREAQHVWRASWRKRLVFYAVTGYSSLLLAGLWRARL